MSATNHLENELLDHVFGNSTYTPPATLYVGLAQSVAEDGTITGEPSGNGYARVAVTNDATNFPTASDGSKTNGTDITFPEATGDWGTLNVWFIADAATGGNVLVFGDLTNPKTVGNGDTVHFPASYLTITAD